MKLIVGTRGSKLALIQTDYVIDRLQSNCPHAEIELKIIKTLGDKEGEKPLFTIDRRGIFEKELDHAIGRGEIDFAVHSLKDVPTQGSAASVIAAIPQRSSPHDVLFSRYKRPLEALPKCAVIGTGSLRRLAEVKHLRPDIEVQAIRGNVDTRLKKVRSGELDGVIVAEAGLERMSLENLITERFPLDKFTPAAGQGALAVTAKKDNQEVIKFLSAIDHAPTRAEVMAERSIVLTLEGGCRVPIGTIGRASNHYLSIYGCVFSVDGKEKISATAKGNIDMAEELGRKVAQKLIEQGAKDFEVQWRQKYGAW